MAALPGEFKKELNWLIGMTISPTIREYHKDISPALTVEVVRLKITEAGRQALTASRGKST
jgi:hypothetical protein